MKEVQFSVLRPLSTKFASTLILCYTYLAALLYSGNREEVSNMSSLFNSFLVTVRANVVSYYICKWLSRHTGQVCPPGVSKYVYLMPIWSKRFIIIWQSVSVYILHDPYDTRFGTSVKGVPLNTEIILDIILEAPELFSPSNSITSPLPKN